MLLMKKHKAKSVTAPPHETKPPHITSEHSKSADTNKNTR